jgi:PatG Domain
MTEQERESAEQQGQVIEQSEGAAQQPARQPAQQANAPAPPTSPAQPTPAEVERAASQPSYVYAIGTVEPRFPTLAAEKEFAQTTGRAEGTEKRLTLCFQTGRIATWCVSCAS